MSSLAPPGPCSLPQVSFPGLSPNISHTAFSIRISFVQASFFSSFPGPISQTSSSGFSPSIFPRPLPNPSPRAYFPDPFQLLLPQAYFTNPFLRLLHGHISQIPSPSFSTGLFPRPFPQAPSPGLFLLLFHTPLPPINFLPIPFKAKPSGSLRPRSQGPSSP